MTNEDEHAHPIRPDFAKSKRIPVHVPDFDVGEFRADSFRDLFQELRTDSVTGSTVASTSTGRLSELDTMQYFLAVSTSFRASSIRDAGT